MRILEVSSLMEPTPPIGYGGTERFVHTFAKELSNSGNEVLVICKEGSGYDNNYHKLETNYVQLPEALSPAISEFKPDLIHVHIQERALMQFLSTVDLPIVMEIHNNVRKSSRWVETIRGHKPNYSYIAISHSIYERLYEALNAKSVPVPNENIYEGLYGLDVESMFNHFEHRDKSYFLYLGVIAQYKGVLSIAQKFNEFGERLNIVGPVNNPQEQGYFEKISKYIDGDKIVYTPGTKDENHKKEILLEAQGLVINTGYEPPENDCHEAFGLVMLEANSLGVPVIGYSQGNIRDYIKYGINGFLYSDIQELPNLANEVKQRGREMISGCQSEAIKHDIRGVVKDRMKIFERILEKYS